MHEEVLVPRARKIFPRLARFKNFYLVGGTALALQIGHRVSVDFDLFTSHALSLRILQDVKRILKGHIIRQTYHAPGQLHITADDVKMTFFSYPYPTIEPLIFFHKLPLISVAEIAAMKAHAIGRRLAYKDYVDWYFMLKDGHVSIDNVIRLCGKKFGSDFNARLFLGQLASFSDVRTQEIDYIGRVLSRARIEKFLDDVVRKYMKSALQS